MRRAAHAPRSLTTRFTMLIVLMVLAVASSCIVGVVSLGRLNDVMQTVVREDMQRVLSITTVRRLFRSMVVLERDHILEPDEREQSKIAAKMLETRSKLVSELAVYEGFTSEQERSGLEDLRGAFDRWCELDDRVLSVSTGAHRETAAELARSHAGDPVSWEAVIAGLVGDAERKLAAKVEATNGTYVTSRGVLVGASLGALLVALSLGTWVFLGIRRAVKNIVHLNADLERRVDARTRELAARERAMQLVLDSTGEGLLSVDAGGHVLDERSKAVAEWFGEGGPSRPRLEALLYPDAEAERERAAMSFAFTQLTDGVLPFELAAAQMPQRLSRQDRTFELSYRPILEGAASAGVLVIVRDVTTRVASERAERLAAEQHAMVAALLRDKAGFKAFVDETDRLLASLVPTNARPEIVRAVHTIKGNSATFGLASVAERCHAIETAMEDEPELPADLADELVALWRERLRAVGEFVVGTDDIEVRSSDYTSLLSDLRRRRDYQEMLGFVQTWSWDRTSDRLGRLAAQASQIGERLGKPVAIHIEHNDLRMTGENLDELWAALIHVVRNAVDHGIEPEDVRARAGKPREGSLTFTTRRARDGIMTITLADDGCGIDYEQLSAKARAKGIEVDDPEDLPFVDGLSSREDVSEISGRGVGMSAVRAACERAGGTMRVVSERGRGTCFELRFDTAAERAVRAVGARAA